MIDINKNNNIFELCYIVLSSPSIKVKLDAIDRLHNLRDNNDLCFERERKIEEVEDYAYPDTLDYVHVSKLEQRKITTDIGKNALVHAIAHIEFNAIHLGCDAIYRFEGMPIKFYLDWLQVAIEEAKHFSLLRSFLEDNGYHYGSFPVHNGLWSMAKKTRHDVMIRMALVPRLLEARGLDVTPGLIAKFEKLGEKRLIEILNIIFEDEIGHVKIGNYWYAWLCNLRALEPIDNFKSLLEEYAPNILQEPILDDVREMAGFSQAELALLHDMAS